MPGPSGAGLVLRYRRAAGISGRAPPIIASCSLPIISSCSASSTRPTRSNASMLFWRGARGLASRVAPAGTAEEARAALLRRQLHPSEPRPLARQIELPQGTVLPRFSLISLPPEETPGLDSFLCSHLTPELMRRPEWLAHPNGAIGLKAVHVLVESTAPLLPAYDRLFGIVQVTTTDAVAVGPYRPAASGVQHARRFSDDASWDRHRSRIFRRRGLSRSNSASNDSNARSTI